MPTGPLPEAASGEKRTIRGALTRRWLRRHARMLADTPTWALMQELKFRGALRDAPSTEAGITKDVRPWWSDNGIAVDSYGCPLLQQMGDDGLPLYAPRPDDDPSASGSRPEGGAP